MSEAKRIFKDQLYEQFARVAKALAHQHRIELIDLLAQAERSVEDLAFELGPSRGKCFAASSSL